MTGGATLLTVGVVAVLALLVYAMFFRGAEQTAFGGATGTTGTTSNVNVNPTATYSTIDTYSTTAVTGTGFYKQDGLPISTTAIGNVNPGTEYTYWLQNGSWYVKPFVFTAGSLNNQIVNKVAVQNGSVTVNVIDSATGLSLTVGGGANNISGSANAVGNIQIKYTGGSKTSALPFGGVMVVEYKNTISSVTCTGADLLASNPYHVTYAVSAVTNTFTQFGVADTIDSGNGALHEIDCNIKQGASASSGSNFIIKFIPANYYVTNAGAMMLDTQKNDNADNTRTGLGVVSATYGFT